MNNKQESKMNREVKEETRRLKPYFGNNQKDITELEISLYKIFRIAFGYGEKCSFLEANADKENLQKAYNIAMKEINRLRKLLGYT